MKAWLQQQTGGAQRRKSILFWGIVVFVAVVPFVAWKFAITRFVFALVFIVLFGRLIEREFAKFAKRPPLVVVQAVTYAFVVAIWSLIVATESVPRFGRPLDFATPARMFLIPELCWFAYEFVRLRRMPPASRQQ